MMKKTQIEIFIGNCPLCDDTVQLVQKLANSSCEVMIYNLSQGQMYPNYLEKAQKYGVNAVPAIAINGTLALIGKPNQEQLRAIELN